MIRVATAGWSYADWEGCVHPKPKPAGYHALDLLPTVFDGVEINASFYADLRRQVVEGWLERTADSGFEFLVKLGGRFTHERERRFDGPSELRASLAEFRASLGALPDSVRCRALLAQFPLSFRPTERARRYLWTLLEELGGWRVVLELRHREWYSDALVAACLERGASLAAIDLPDGPDHPPAGFAGAGPIGYLRLHGRSGAWFDAKVGRDPKYDYRYSGAEVGELADLARRIDARAEETHVVTNNHFSGQAVAAGVELLSALGRPPASLPANWIEAFPDLGRIAPARGQQALF